jgi:uncharacterized surface protein with fasciclin (FAS1) repeats
VKTRNKTFGAVAAIAAIAVSIPTAVTAYADDPTPTPTPTTTVSTPVAPIPNPEGPGCDAYKSAVPSGAGSFASMATEPASQAIANNPQLTTFNAAISGQLNPAVNVTSVLDNGPYVVFAPTDDAFAKLEPGQLDALKADPAALTSLVYYHMALGLLGPQDVHGKLTSQQGKQITVDGKGGDIKVDDTAKVVCGGITAKNAKIYMIDTVLNPAESLGPATTSSTATTSTTATTPTSAPAEAPAPAPAAPAAPATTAAA